MSVSSLNVYRVLMSVLNLPLDLINWIKMMSKAHRKSSGDIDLKMNLIKRLELVENRISLYKDKELERHADRYVLWSITESVRQFKIEYDGDYDRIKEFDVWMTSIEKRVNSFVELCKSC